MAFNLAEYFQKQGLVVVETSLRTVVGKPPSLLENEAIYRQQVIQPSWLALPVAVRMMIKKQFGRWDEMYLALRDQVFDRRLGHIQFQPQASVRIASTVQRFFGGEQSAAPPAGPVPMAMPVLSPDRTVPLALPVGTSDQPAPAAAEDSSPVVGIDLGTTYSVIAHVNTHGQPVSLLNRDGDRLTPSVVLFGEDGTIVGKQALLGSALEPENTADCVKRDMGGKYYRRRIHGDFMPPEVISSFVLRSLKEDAERVLGPVRRVVITVPAYFDDTRRRATVDAGRLAGLEVLDIINEPTAAAIAYGYQLGYLDRQGLPAGDRPLRVLVFDLGGGTFDVTIVEIQKGDFKALATDGDVCLGGKDWDDRIIALAAEHLRSQSRDDPRDNPFSLRELQLAAEEAKRTLSERPRATLLVNHLGSRHKVEVTRVQFEKATASLLERTRMTTEIVVRQAGLTFADLDRILLVGGATRMPMIGRMIEELTGKAPDRSVSVDEAVAHGAALYANLFVQPAQRQVEFGVTNINSHSLGIQGTDPQTGEHRNKVLIPRNTRLPCTVTKHFQTFKKNQRSVAIKVLEGESPRPEFCSLVGTCTIPKLPRGLPVGWVVDVSYSYEANGRLHVTAKVKEHDVGVTSDFLRENRLADEDLEMWAHFIEEELTGPKEDG